MLRLIAPFTDDVIQFPYEQAVLSKYRLRGLGGKRKQVRLGLTGASYRWATIEPGGSAPGAGSLVRRSAPQDAAPTTTVNAAGGIAGYSRS
jgi:hypothetical protein